METDCDALVIGAGPAGSVAATLLARAGLSVRLVEKKPFPRRKVCGACLSGFAVSGLRAAGLEHVLDKNGAILLSSFRLASNGRTATVPLRAGCALSRRTLDAALVEAAVAAGARFDDGLTAELGLIKGEARTVALSPSDAPSARETVRAKIVLVAAGLTGVSLRHDPELRSTPAAGARVGAGAETAGFADAYDPGAIFMATHRAGYVGLVRTEAGSLNIAAALDPRFVSAQGGLGPAAAAVVAQAGFPAAGLAGLDWTGTPPLTRRPAALAAERVFLIGDAAGYVEPFTGEGIGWAVAAASAVSPLAQRAVAGWSPALVREWSPAYERAVGRRQRLCRFIARALRSPAAVAASVRLLGSLPAAASPVLRHLAGT
jgi:flavin-dependent dehydrogenase